MERETEKIKVEFEQALKNIEEKKVYKDNVNVIILYTVSIIMFVLVLFGTIISYKNYIDAKNKVNNTQTEVILKY